MPVSLVSTVPSFTYKNLIAENPLRKDLIPKPHEVDMVLYHGNHCPDGFAAAWSAWKRRGDKAEYIPLRYDSTPPDVTGKNVVMVDFAFNDRAVIERMINSANKMIILDHHESQMDNLADLPQAVFAQEYSGAVMAWQFFNPRETTPPELLEYIQDRDLGRLRLSQSRYYNAAVLASDLDFETYDNLANLAPRTIIDRGRAITHYRDNFFSQMAEGAIEVDFNGLKAVVVNANQVFRTEFGFYLKEKFPDCDLVMLYHDFPGTDQIKVSLRSNTVDVKEIAKKLSDTAGGHKNAAGCSFAGTINDLLAMKFNI